VKFAITDFKKNEKIKGTSFAIKRIIKCNPFVQPQIDKI